jgi:hypothetical protein
MAVGFFRIMACTAKRTLELLPVAEMLEACHGLASILRGCRAVLNLRDSSWFGGSGIGPTPDRFDD